MTKCPYEVMKMSLVFLTRLGTFLIFVVDKEADYCGNIKRTTTAKFTNGNSSTIVEQFGLPSHTLSAFSKKLSFPFLFNKTNQKFYFLGYF